MLKTRKWLLAFSVALVGIIVSLLISFFPSIVEAKAEMKYFSAEQYTESDQLLQADGNPSPNRSIEVYKILLRMLSQDITVNLFLNSRRSFRWNIWKVQSKTRNLRTTGKKTVSIW